MGILKEMLPDRHMQAKKELSPARKTASVVAGLLLIAVAIGGVIYNAGSPWNCEQARSMAQDFQRQMDKLSLNNPDDAHEYDRLARQQQYMQSKAASMCSP